jgi:4-hydroxy-3-polyprenylbenzoate decarboxylase
MSLTKYLLIVAKDDDPHLEVQDVSAFWRHVLERVDWRRDLHFQTCTTIDTLDYSGRALNDGSKVVIAAVGAPVRTLPTEPASDLQLPEGFGEARVCLPGVLAIAGLAFASDESGRDRAVQTFCESFSRDDPINQFPLIVIVDDSQFTSRTLSNFLWVTFTRSNPAADVYGIASCVDEKHWGCRGSLVIDARIKPHHAPPLVESAEITRKVDALAARGGPLAKYI